jgi:RimJ/RimL family protein N-acetyltransferase
LAAGSTPALRTARLGLRRFRDADAEALFNLDADPRVMRFISGGSGSSRAMVERQILPRFIREQDDADIFGFWAAEHGEVFAGWFSLRRIDGLPGEASLGYRLRRQFWGQGLATEGASLLVDRGFRLGALEKIIATTYEENLASIAVMTKLGLRFQRSFKISADELEAMDTADLEASAPFPGMDVEYAIDRASWQAGQSRT